jgi:pimeloyl-ACP methyl ester carboxylesterase
MDKLGIKKAVIMGLSLGGYVAIDFALKYPERVSALVLAAPGLTGYEFKSKAFSKYLEQYRKAAGEKNKEAMAEAFLAGWTDGPYRKPSQVDPIIRKKIKNMILGTFANTSPRGRQIRLEPAAINRLSELHVPTLAIVGTLDMPGIIEIVNLIEKNVSGAKKVLIKDVAHMLNMEKPAEYNRIVLDFLNCLSSKNAVK